MRTRVKVCGLTQRQDAEFAAEIGVDAIGLVFYPASPRAVTIAQAKEVLAGLPPFVTVVALFVDADVDDVKACLAALPIDLLQFHGNESPEYCQQFERPYMKAIRMKEDVDLLEQAAKYHSASALLLDTYQKGLPGGTGRAFDWSRVESITKPVVLAGGLTVENVSEAITQVSPYAVDVSGGVEKAKGIKDFEKMSAFMQEVLNGRTNGK